VKKLPDSRPQELIRSEKLLYNGNVEEALELVMNFEKRSDITPKDQLSALILKGWIHANNIEPKKAVEIGELAYSKSQELGLVRESIDSLLLQAEKVFLIQIKEAFNLILKVEKLLKSLSDESLANIISLKLNKTFLKSWIYFYKTDYSISLDLAMEALTLAEKIKNNYKIGTIFFLIGAIHERKGEHDTALEYEIKALDIFEKLDFQSYIASSIQYMGFIYLLKGELNLALEYCKKCLSMEKISDRIKAPALGNLGTIYREKGELNKALKYTQQAFIIAEKNLFYRNMTLSKRNIGKIYMLKGEYKQAIEYFKQSLVLGEKGEDKTVRAYTLLSLILIYIENNSREQAHEYLKRLEDLFPRFEKISAFRHVYPLGKALMLKASKRMLDQADAVRLLKNIVEDDIADPEFHILALISLCEFLIEELSIYNNPEVIDEINPLIAQLLKIAEDQHSNSWLAEGKLLQAKLALIQMNIEEAKKLLTDAQNTAESHGLIFLSQKISKEHDNLLEQLDEWQTLKNNKAPISDRIKLASVDDVIDRLQGKRAVEPPELVDEEPILLLIMDNSGTTYFNHPFMTNWDYGDLFSSFMSAFNTFSSEIFSKSIDRIRIGENTILINPIESFLTCYVIKGQSYPALQKLTRFTEAIRENSEIWQALNKSVKTSEMLGFDNSPALKTAINEIFTQ
jgi:tetratricopeptide (TPR) repeat protein